MLYRTDRGQEAQAASPKQSRPLVRQACQRQGKRDTLRRQEGEESRTRARQSEWSKHGGRPATAKSVAWPCQHGGVGSNKQDP